MHLQLDVKDEHLNVVQITDTHLGACKDAALVGVTTANSLGCVLDAVTEAGAPDLMLLTGDLVDGREAADMGLVLEAVPLSQLDERVEAIAGRIAGVPKNQLMMKG